MPHHGHAIPVTIIAYRPFHYGHDMICRDRDGNQHWLFGREVGYPKGDEGVIVFDEGYGAKGRYRYVSKSDTVAQTEDSE